jgi:hypothetical protein
MRGMQPDRVLLNELALSTPPMIVGSNEGGKV